jgi:N-methylhydantoinase A
VPAELRFGAPERMSPDGPLRPLQAHQTARLLAELAGARPQAVAVALLHSYAHPEHELHLGELIAQRLPDAHVSLSHELVGTFREYERAASTEIDAALSPLLAAYLGGLQVETRRRRLPAPHVMQSSGGLTDAARAAAHAALTVLSGPAGGVGGALLLSAAYILCLAACVAAFRRSVPIASIAVVYLTGSAFGSIMPTPGGLGAVELALTAGLTAAGLPSAVAGSSVLLFRLLTFWLPVPAGWIALNYLERHEALLTTRRPAPEARGAGQAPGSAGSAGAVPQMT